MISKNAMNPPPRVDLDDIFPGCFSDIRTSLTCDWINSSLTWRILRGKLVGTNELLNSRCAHRGFMDKKETSAPRYAAVPEASGAKRRPDPYGRVLSRISTILDAARHASARAVNRIMTETYWRIGQIIVEFEQSGRNRALYGDRLIRRLSEDLTSRFGRGFGIANLHQMRKFYLGWDKNKILQTVSGEFIVDKGTSCGSGSLPTAINESDSDHLLGRRKKIPQTVSAKFNVFKDLHPLKKISQDKWSKGRGPGELDVALRFPLPWSHYNLLLFVANRKARSFYETEALRGGWSVRQLKRQVESKFYASVFG